MKYLNFNKILCLSPHPDDVELGVSGTIIKYQDTQFDILTLSLGGVFEGSNPMDRRSEVCNAWADVNVKNCKLDFGNLKPEDNSQSKLVNKIETEYLKSDHDAILVPTWDDSHFEHRKTNELASALTRCKNISIIEYRTPSTLHKWTPNIFIDITDHYDRKLSMLKHFDSQSNKKYFDKIVLDTFHTDFQSSKKGNKFVEQFKLIQLYGK